MPALFLAFLATALATLAGRDGVRIARLAAAGGNGSGVMLLAAILPAAVLAAGLAAVLADGMARMLQPEARQLLVAVALAAAGAEVLLLGPGRAPVEPTRSLFAIMLVLAGGLLTGASGFLVLALAVLSGMPLLAAVGGALGAGAALALAALAGADWEQVPQRSMRLGGGVLLLLAAVMVGVQAL